MKTRRTGDERTEILCPSHVCVVCHGAPPRSTMVYRIFFRVGMCGSRLSQPFRPYFSECDG